MLSIFLLTVKLHSPSVPRAGFWGLNQSATLPSGFLLVSANGGLCDEDYAMEDYAEDPRREEMEVLMYLAPSLPWIGCFFPSKTMFRQPSQQSPTATAEPF